MANPQVPAQAPSNILSTHRALVSTISSFLTVSIHHILFLRRIYPPVSFLSTRAYNYPVRQSRHPTVCSWILDAIAAVRDQLEKNTVEQVAICIFECDNNRVLERWTFDLRGFPVVEKRERDVPFEETMETAQSNEDQALRKKINIADLEAQFRGMLARMTSSAGRLKPLPEGPDAPEVSFTVTIEVKDDADRPVGRMQTEERKWIAAEPDAFEDLNQEANSLSDEDKAEKVKPNTNQQHGKTVPVRRLEAGQLRMEVWIEESKAKFDYDTSVQSIQRSTSVPQLPDENLNTITGMDLEPPDINRNPQSGAMSDYRR